MAMFKAIASWWQTRRAAKARRLRGRFSGRPLTELDRVELIEHIWDLEALLAAVIMYHAERWETVAVSTSSMQVDSPYVNRAFSKPGRLEWDEDFKRRTHYLIYREEAQHGTQSHVDHDRTENDAVAPGGAGKPGDRPRAADFA